MRKIFAFITAVLVLSSVVLGCSCDNGAVDDKKGTEVPVISPLPSPDAENGMVNDGDGYIEGGPQEKGYGGSASDKKSDIEEDIILQPQPSESPDK